MSFSENVMFALPLRSRVIFTPKLLLSQDDWIIKSVSMVGAPIIGLAVHVPDHPTCFASFFVQAVVTLSAPTDCALTLRERDVERLARVRAVASGPACKSYAFRFRHGGSSASVVEYRSGATFTVDPGGARRLLEAFRAPNNIALRFITHDVMLRAILLAVHTLFFAAFHDLAPQKNVLVHTTNS